MSDTAILTPADQRLPLAVGRRARGTLGTVQPRTSGESCVDDPARDDLYRGINYRICTALDILKLDMVLEEMVVSAGLHPTEAQTFLIQAKALLASIRQANDRAFGKEPRSPIV
jgi:hypothetical protein